MTEGDIVLAPVPQADGEVKQRPAVVLREMPRYRDFLVCGVTTQLHQLVAGFDERIDSTDKDFAASGFLQSSVIRLGFLGVIPRRSIAGTIGRISSARHRRLLEALAAYLTDQQPVPPRPGPRPTG